MKDWLDKLSDEIVNAGEVPPKGFKNREEIQKQLKYASTAGAIRWIKKAMATGKMQKVIVRRPTKSGGIACVPYYGPASKH